MEDTEKYWKQIQELVQQQFRLPGEVYDVLFMVGVQELGYGFQQLDQETKTKVFNFASIYLMNYMDADQRRQIHERYPDEAEAEEQIYKQAIINYFKEKNIL